VIVDRQPIEMALSAHLLRLAEEQTEAIMADDLEALNRLVRERAQIQASLNAMANSAHRGPLLQTLERVAEIDCWNISLGRERAAELAAAVRDVAHDNEGLGAYRRAFSALPSRGLVIDRAG
jgi:hypothetical protein